eukprot:10941369-Ditylum_brightwellii.AAC.1
MSKPLLYSTIYNSHVMSSRRRISAMTENQFVRRNSIFTNCKTSGGATLLPRMQYNIQQERRQLFTSFQNTLDRQSSVPPFQKFSTSASNSSIKEFLSKIKSSLPHLSINTNPYDLSSHGRGESYHPTAPPSAILTPSSSSDIQTILQYANQYKVPIIPYGAGTSVEGHLNALYGGVSLDMTNFNEIELMDDGLEDFFVRVGAGVTRKTLNEAL